MSTHALNTFGQLVLLVTALNLAYVVRTVWEWHTGMLTGWALRMIVTACAFSCVMSLLMLLVLGWYMLQHSEVVP